MINQEPLKLFDKIYYDTYKTVLKYIVCNCSNIEDVKDIVQNVYLEVYKNINKIINVNDYSLYVLGIAKNKIKDYYRFKYKHKLIKLNDDNEIINIIPSETDIENIVLVQENINIIWNYLTKKNSVISKIFYLYYYESFSLKEIADMLNLSLSNVKHYLYRTLKELNGLISNRGEDNEK